MTTARGAASAGPRVFSCDTLAMPVPSHYRPAELSDSDAERERALGALKASYAAGQLSVRDLEARVDHVFRFGVGRGVGAWLRALPLWGVRWLIVGRVRRVQRTVLRMHLFTYATANASLVGLWELTGHGAFWPAWFLVPSTLLIVWHAAASRMLSRALSRIS
jgi:Domain of unknown function (DUF1707)